jgi:Family of unknown function (DUF6232)
MDRSLKDAKSPQRWGIRGPADAPSRQIFWMGSHEVAIHDIRSVKAEEIRERPIDGLLIGAALFMVAALVMAFGVFESGWRPRFLLGTLFLGFLGCAGIYEITKLRRQRYFVVDIATGRHGVLQFASADEREVMTLLATFSRLGI